MTTYTTKLQYSDGRMETVVLPSSFETGDILAITHLKNGSVVAQRVTPKSGDNRAVQIWYGPIPANYTVAYKFYVKRYISQGESAKLYYEHGTATLRYGPYFTYSNSSDWSDTGNVTYYSINSTQLHFFMFYVTGLLPGDYVRIDVVTYSGTDWPNIPTPDSSFESGKFGDGTTKWKSLTEDEFTRSFRPAFSSLNNARIISSDAYAGTHCLEFYG